MPPTVNGVVITTYPLEPSDASILPDAQAYHGEDPNSQERKQRRRKRKRRPQSSQPAETQGNNIEMPTEWQPEQTEASVPDNQLASNDQKDSIFNPSGGIFAHAEVQSQVVRVQGVKDAIGRSRIRENIQATTTKENDSSSPRPINKSYRRPYSVAKKEEVEAKQSESSNTSSNRAADIKNLLKQSGGLSLSEILQQQNLSLDDLLKGKQKALKALQNTAAPPQSAEPLETTASTKTTRRIPPPPSRQPQTTPSIKEVTHEYASFRRNLTNRISNYQRPQMQSQQQTTQPAPVHESRESSEQPMVTYLAPTKKLVSTIPTFTTPASTVEVATIANNADIPSVRRLPVHRTKPIKEVVSAIRPDLNNSGSRKRMPMFMPAGNRTNNVVYNTSQTKPAFEVQPAKPKERTLPPRYHSNGGGSLRLTNFNVGKGAPGSSSSEETKPIAQQVSSTTAAPTTPATTTTTTTMSTTTTRTTTFTAASTPLEIARMNNRNRMVMRPRLRPPIHISTTIAPRTEDTAGTENIVYITTSLPPQQESSQFSREEVPNASNKRPEFDINKKLNESKPELNVIEVELEPYQEVKPKHSTSLEDLFLTDDEPTDNSEETIDDGVSEDELIHSSTSRSYQFAGSNENDLTRYPPKYSGPPSDRGRPSYKKPYTDVTERNPSLFTDINTRIFDDKTELMDLLEDRRSGSRLVKVLQQRNMTLDELIEHRKRGSSQVHLAEIFWNRTAPVESPKESHEEDRLDIVTAFENFPKFNLDNLKSIKPDEIKTDSQGSSYFTSIFNINPTNEVFKEGRAVRDPPIMINLASAMASGRVNGIPNSAWSSSNDYDNDNFGISGENVDHNHLERPANRAPVISNSSPRRSPPPESFHDIDLLDNDAARSHDLLDLELSGHGFKRQSIDNAEMPLGVRSAIVASASIVCVSLGIFLVIFLTCRWRQKRRKKVTYSDRFQAVRGRLPILNSRGASPAKRGSSPPMFLYGSRRSSRLNTMDPNSPVVHDYLYEAMRKPFQ